MIRRTLDLSGLTPMNRTQIEQLVHAASGFASRIFFEHGTRTFSGKSMLGMLTMGVTGHDPVYLTTDGRDEEAACETIVKMLESGMAPPKNATDAMRLMLRVKASYLQILQDKLEGIYLHGSLAEGCFLWERSDIDFLVVARRPLTVEEKVGLVETLYALTPEAPPEGFEMSVILKQYCRNIPCPIPFEIHYSARYRRDYERDARGFCQRMHGEDLDLTTHILNLSQSGLTILGPDIPRLFDQVKKEDALRAIRADVADAREHLHENPVYYVLNLCRSLAYLRQDVALSKKEGGEWALRNLNPDHQRVIQAALNAYGTGLGMFYDEREADEFCCDALKELQV